ASAAKAQEPAKAEIIKLEPLSLSPSDDQTFGGRDPLDFTLALDEDPFRGPETNDDFLGLDELDDPRDRKGDRR
ncbi:MAG: hypothetical protein LBE01_04785, partial [Deltaproteobacteria bacterium]|nr:hypothetical protein [Deltaproteobacteria bacterium]